MARLAGCHRHGTLGTLRLVHSLQSLPVNDSELPAPSAAAPARVSFERLRERTDELELIISGLSLFALLSLPGWLWGFYEDHFARMTMGTAAVTVVLLPVVSAICYVMAGLFLLHLGVRAHWVGLIGLKSVFPLGVRWERLEGVGPVTLATLRARLPSLEHGIVRADAMASTLFSLITFSAMAVAVLGGWLGLLFVVAGLYGDHLGGTNTFVNRAGGWLFSAYTLLPLARWLLDGLLLRRFPRLQRWAPLRALARLLGWLESLFLPPRLLGLTRLSLQSNLLPRLFLVLFLGAVVVVLFGSNQVFQRARAFDVFDSQTYLGQREVAGGLRSSHYESLRIPRDALVTRPLIPAPLIETAWLPVFLPYTAVIDDPVLAQRCPPRPVETVAPFGFDARDSDVEALQREAQIDARAAAAVECLRRLWEVRLDGVVQSLDGFVPSERADLGLRGLSGWLPLSGLAPGPHRLEVIWRPRPEQDTLKADHVPRRVRHVIPFVWSPEAAAQPAMP
jgi:hypothetical protein